jgi:hypothetical protein
MEIGTAIFLSSVMLGTIALYIATMDRWPWKRVAQAFGLFVLAIIVVIIIAIKRPDLIVAAINAIATFWRA